MAPRARSLVLIRAGLLEHFPAKHALGLDPGVGNRFAAENATTKGKQERIPIPPERNSL
jgi:hypothetical protein